MFGERYELFLELLADFHGGIGGGRRIGGADAVGTGGGRIGPDGTPTADTVSTGVNGGGTGEAADGVGLGEGEGEEGGEEEDQEEYGASVHSGRGQ